VKGNPDDADGKIHESASESERFWLAVLYITNKERLGRY